MEYSMKVIAKPGCTSAPPFRCPLQSRGLLYFGAAYQLRCFKTPWGFENGLMVMIVFPVGLAHNGIKECDSASVQII